MAYDPLNLPNNAIPEGTDISHIEEGVTELYNSLTDLDILGQIGTEIPSGSDLNDYTDTGKYFSRNASTSASLSNMPNVTIGGFSLYVIQVQQASRKMQIILDGYYNHIYFRSWNENNWTTWRQATETVVS